MANKKSDTKQFLEECGFDPAEITDAHIDALDHAFIALEHDSIPPQQLSAEEEADRILAKAKSMGLLEEKDEAYMPSDEMSDSVQFLRRSLEESAYDAPPPRESVFTRRVPTYAMALAAVFSVLIGYGVRDLTQNDTAEFDRYVMQERNLMSAVSDKKTPTDKQALSERDIEAAFSHYKAEVSDNAPVTLLYNKAKVTGKAPITLKLTLNTLFSDLAQAQIPLSISYKDDLTYLSVKSQYQSAAVFKDLDLTALKTDNKIVIEFLD